MLLIRIRNGIRDLFAPGGLRRHPLLAIAALALVALIIVGLVLRPL